MKTLYDALLEQGLAQPESPRVSPEPSEFEGLTGKAFAEAVLHSEEFRLYIIEGLIERDLPPAVLCRLMDHGWGKPAERHEHTGKDGEPIVTEVRRVIVHARSHEDFINELEAEASTKVDPKSKRTH